MVVAKLSLSPLVHHSTRTNSDQRRGGTEMRLVGTSGAVLLNEGLDPGVQVAVDGKPRRKATVCFTEKDAAYCCVRLERTGKRLRVASWRLARLG